MNLFQSVLSQIKEKIGLEEDKINSVVTIIKTITAISISSSEVQIKKGVLILKTQPTVKMALLLKKESIISALHKEGIKITTIQ